MTSPAATSRARSVGVLGESRNAAAAIASASSTGTRRQFTPSRRNSLEPPVAVAMTGVEHAIASSGTSPNGSAHLGTKTNASAAA